MLVGFHASHEQFCPSRLLYLVGKAEKAGFGGVLSSDHFQPWRPSCGNSGYSWSWLGAAMQLSSLPFGIVSTPGYRIHPAIIAQASATIAEMFPNRFWLAAGSGEYLNESPFVTRWPSKLERNQKLKDSVELIGKLWHGESARAKGMATGEEAVLYLLPKKTPLIVGAALSVETAKWLGTWADGMITASGNIESTKCVIDAFRAGGGKNKPIFLKLDISYLSEEGQALEQAWAHWRHTIMGSKLNSTLSSPYMFEEAAKYVHMEDMRKHVFISSDYEQHVEVLEKAFSLGFKQVYVHNVNENQESFIDFYGKRVLPSLHPR